MTETSGSDASGEGRGIQRAHLLAALVGFVVWSGSADPVQPSNPHRRQRHGLHRVPRLLRERSVFRVPRQRHLRVLPRRAPRGERGGAGSGRAPEVRSAPRLETSVSSTTARLLLAPSPRSGGGDRMPGVPRRHRTKRSASPAGETARDGRLHRLSPRGRRRFRLHHMSSLTARRSRTRRTA